MKRDKQNNFLIIILIMLTSCNVGFCQENNAIFKNNQKYQLDWSQLDKADYKVYYLQFNLDLVPTTLTKINLIDSLKCGKGFLLNTAETKRLKNLVSNMASFSDGDCSTFFINAGFVIICGNNVLGFIEMGCSYGQWNFIPNNKFSNNSLLSDDGYDEMTKLLDRINLRMKNARTPNKCI